jgi:hypothetical protein
MRLTRALPAAPRGSPRRTAGKLIEALVIADWQVLRVPKCLFSHYPNPWACALTGEVRVSLRPAVVSCVSVVTRDR